MNWNAHFREIFSGPSLKPPANTSDPRFATIAESLKEVRRGIEEMKAMILDGLPWEVLQDHFRILKRHYEVEALLLSEQDAHDDAG